MLSILKNNKSIVRIFFIFIIFIVFLFFPSPQKLQALKCDQYSEGVINGDASIISLNNLSFSGSTTNGLCSVNCTLPDLTIGHSAVGDPMEKLEYSFDGSGWTGLTKAGIRNVSDWYLQGFGATPTTCTVISNFNDIYIPANYQIFTNYPITNHINIANLSYGWHNLSLRATIETERNRNWTDQFNFNKPTPQVLLTVRKAGTSDSFVPNTITISYNTKAELQWASSYMTDCSVSGGWSGLRALNGTETTGNLTTSTTYIITCNPQDLGMHTGANAQSSTVTVNVTSAPPTNSPPNIPTLIAPPIAWINYNPVFKASVTDADNDQVGAHYNIVSITGDIEGSVVNSGGTSCYPNDCITGLTMSDGNYSWRAYSEDEHGAVSSWTAYQWLGIDKTLPTGTITPTPASPTTSQTVIFNVSASDPIVNTASSGIGKIEIYVDSTLVQTCNSQNTCAYTGGPYSAGAHPYYAVITDNAGNAYIIPSANISPGSAKVNYKVVIDTLMPPHVITATDLSINALSPCDTVPSYIFNWTYTDNNLHNESRFDFQVDDNSNFSSPEVDRSVNNLDYPSGNSNSQAVTLATSTTSPGCGYITYNTTYYWRARVYDSFGEASSWTNGSGLTTLVHHYPKINFTTSLRRPNLNENVNLTDTSTCYDKSTSGADCALTEGDSYQWTMIGGTPGSATTENAITKYATLGLKDITLQITDSDNHTCSATQTIRVEYPLPTWREIAPF